MGLEDKKRRVRINLLTPSQFSKDLVNQLNDEFGLNKSITFYANVWNDKDELRLKDFPEAVQHFPFEAHK